MKEIEEILKNGRIYSVERGLDGFRAMIQMHHFKASLIVSDGGGWEHASISPMKRSIIPSWEDMCFLKELIWNDDEAVVQIHPPKSEYINNVSNCLHLWRCIDKEMPMPPSEFVGKKGVNLI